jgi:dihydrofolate reductase
MVPSQPELVLPVATALARKPASTANLLLITHLVNGKISQVADAMGVITCDLALVQAAHLKPIKPEVAVSNDVASQPDSSQTDKRIVNDVVADMSVSLDGFVADPSDGVERVFAWYAKPQPADTSAPEAGSPGLGVIVYGRRTFDVARGWGGNHPMGVPVIVVTHRIPDGWPREGSTVSFVTDGVQSAIEQASEIAGDKVIAIGSPSITQQCLDLGLLTRINIKLVPLLLGDGIRLFEKLGTAPLELDGPKVTEGNGVTHLTYQVRSALPPRSKRGAAGCAPEC